LEQTCACVSNTYRTDEDGHTQREENLELRNALLSSSNSAFLVFSVTGSDLGRLLETAHHI
jgi:hypothetical protein